MDSNQRQARVTRPHIGGGEGRGFSEAIQQDFRLRTGRGDFSKATQLAVSYFPCLSKQILDRRWFGGIQAQGAGKGNHGWQEDCGSRVAWSAVSSKREKRGRGGEPELSCSPSGSNNSYSAGRSHSCSRQSFSPQLNLFKTPWGVSLMWFPIPFSW